MMGWLQAHERMLQYLGVSSLILFVITLVVLPIAVIKLPEDYFTRENRRPASRSRKYPAFWLALSILKNLLGLVIILVGIAMLVLPGQGIITIVIGLAMTNFPGKYALERRIAGQPTVGRALNKIRKRAGQPPLQLPSDAR